MNGFPPPGAETRQGLENIITLIDRTFPLPGKFRRGLPQDVAELSRLLTGGRGDRTESYLGKPALLSAYLRYFLPWNLYRLCRLLPALPLPLEEGDALSDLGSGPLTLTLGLWLARPELRGLSLEFRCLDRTGAALDAGLELFHALAGPASPWKIRPIRAALGAPIHGRPARLVSAVNLFNELYGKLPETDRTGFYALAEKQARLLAALAPGGSVLVVEPGNPRGGAFIAALRSRLISAGLPPLAPCPHHGPCPLEREPGRSPKGGTRWCHFALDTAAAPAELQRLSAAAGLPKERASLSFLLAGQAGEGAGGQGPADHTPPEPEVLSIRHISDPFPVGGGGEYGRYGCSERGLVLVTGERRAVEACLSGALFQLPPARPERRDPKSGALVVELPSNSARRA